jgi:hypothetical protein
VPSFFEWMLLSLAWCPVLTLLHEVGHALAALALTDGEVKIRMGWWFGFGECTYDASRPRTPRAEAWIAAAGPAVSLGCSVVLIWVVLTRPTGAFVQVGAVCALLAFLLSALPVRYGPGLGDPGAESDGRAVWRILTGAPPGGVAREQARLERQERAVRPLFAAVLAAALVLALLVDPSIALELVAIFGLAYLAQRIWR